MTIRLIAVATGKGRVDAYTLEELKQFDFGSWFDSEFSGEPIYTLQELLELAANHNIGLNIEVKVDSHDVAEVRESAENSTRQLTAYEGKHYFVEL